MELYKYFLIGEINAAVKDDGFLKMAALLRGVSLNENTAAKKLQNKEVVPHPRLF